MIFLKRKNSYVFSIEILIQGKNSKENQKICAIKQKV